MDVNFLSSAVYEQNKFSGIESQKGVTAESVAESETREQFQNILGELLFGQMISAMRKNVGEAAYFNGGRAEEVFTQQLDQKLAQKISEQCSESFVGPMYDLTMSGRK